MEQVLEKLHVAMNWLYISRRRLAAGGIALLAVMLASHVIFGANGMVVYQHKRAEFRSLDKEIRELQTENERLAGQIKALKTDPKTIEKEAREQLRYTRPGEVVYVMPAPAQPPQQPATAQKR
ncbi:MAG TPA: septum formation initiator family protein [Terriglobales bacterium]|nr:septum formation initiator family protein [Terriglobales bacterium]